jgi:beta-lactamase superfamily II metal-dependent hydrolase
MMRVIFYHVGKGDLSLVLTPNGQAMLVDCYKADEVAEGEISATDEFFDQLRTTILEHRIAMGRSNLQLAFLAEQERTQKARVPIALLAITHADKDHILSRERLKDRFNIEYLIDSGREYADPSDAQKDFIAFRAEMKQAGRYKAFKKAAYDVWPSSGVTVDAICPNRDIDKEEDSNNQCLVLRVSYKDKKFLFTGDSPVDDWTNEDTGMLNLHAGKVPADVLNVSHHGSRTFFTPPGPRPEGQPDYTKEEYDTTALEKISPMLSFITCSDDEDAEHPHPIALELYQELTNPSVEKSTRKSHVILSRDSQHLHHVVDVDGCFYMRTSRTQSDHSEGNTRNGEPYLVGTVSSPNGYLTESGIWVSNAPLLSEAVISFTVKAKGTWSGSILYDWWVLNNGQGNDRYHREFYTIESKDRKKQSSWNRPLKYEGVHIMQCHAETADKACWANWFALVCHRDSLKYAQKWLEIFPGCIDKSKINPRW